MQHVFHIDSANKWRSKALQPLAISSALLALVLGLATLALLRPTPTPAQASPPDLQPASPCSWCSPQGEEECPLMRPSPEEKQRWVEDYRRAPEVALPRTLTATLEKAPGEAFSLLDRLEYTPAERWQGTCGNCWVWAGTGVMEVALATQNGVRDRLSIQYFNSNYNKGKAGEWACCGGWLTNFAAFYAEEKKIVPWSNINAAWADAGRRCFDSTSVPASSISTNPSYVVQSITVETIPTYGLTKEQAIANIKAVLHQNRAVWFAFFLANTGDVQAFLNFWWNQPEDAIWNPNYTCGKTYDPFSGGGHAVLCVGYNDEDPDNRYWIMLNSWGAPPNRPHGIFRVSMDMNYNCTHGGAYGGQVFFWQTLDVAFAPSVPSVAGAYQMSGNIKFYDWTGKRQLLVSGGTLFITEQDDHKVKGYWEPDVVPEGWPTLVPVSGYVGTVTYENHRVANTPRLSLLAQGGEYSRFPTVPYDTCIINARVKLDRYTGEVRYLKGNLYGWGQWGNILDGELPEMGQFEGKFTATPSDGTTLPATTTAPVPGSIDALSQALPGQTVELDIPDVQGTYPTTCSIKFYDWKCNKLTPITGGTLFITEQNGHKVKGYWQPDVTPEGWPELEPLEFNGYVGPLVRIDGKVKNTPRLSLLLEAGEYCKYPDGSYVTYVLNSKIKWDKKLDKVKSIKGSIYGWGEWGAPDPDEPGAPLMGQFEGKFTATPQ